MKTKFATCGVTLFLMLGCKSPMSENEAPAGTTSHEQLTQVQESFSTLLPLVLDPIKFNSPNNAELIERHASSLARFVHSPRSIRRHVGDNVTQDLFVGNFSEDLIEARKQLNIGNRTYSRFLIQTAAQYCVSCHSEGGRGPNFLASPRGSFFNNLSAVDKANYLFAVHSYSAGKAEFEKALAQPQGGTQPYVSFEAAALKALAVAVRVDKSPAKAAALIKRFQGSSWASESLKQSAKVWSVSVNDWAGDRDQDDLSLNDVKELLNRAMVKETSDPMLRTGLIENLRAYSAARELIEKRKPVKTYVEALYYAGLAAEPLKDLEPFNVRQSYWAECIQQLPHSKIATSCYSKLEGGLLGRYTELDYIPVPGRVRENLISLRNEAEPNDEPEMEWGQQH